MTNLYRATIPAIYSRVLVDLMTERGYCVDAMLEASDLNFNQLTDPDAYVSPVQQGIVAANIMRMANDPGLGLAFGGRLDISTVGVLGQAIVTSADVREALDKVTRYFKIRCLLINVRFFEEDGDAVVEFEEAIGLGGFMQFAMESVIAGFYNMGLSVLNDDKVLGELRFAYKKPANEADYHASFNHPVSFERGANQIRFKVDVLDQAMPFANREACALATEQCEKRLQELAKVSSLIIRVKEKLRANPHYFPSLNLMAEQCYMSPRTLTRRLRKLNTSYQQVLDSFRCSLAIEYLRRGGMTVDEISRRMGYNDPSNFGRAFKSWTGQPPSYYRNGLSA